MIKDTAHVYRDNFMTLSENAVATMTKQFVL